MSYESVARARFEIERTPDGEQVRIKARRQIFAMLFLPLWLIGNLGTGYPRPIRLMATSLDPSLRRKVAARSPARQGPPRPALEIVHEIARAQRASGALRRPQRLDLA